MRLRAYSAQETLQTLSYEVLNDCMDQFFMVYDEDILMFSKETKSLNKHFNIVLKRLRDNRLRASPGNVEY